MSQLSANQFPVRTFGGPTALFEYGGLRFLTDPTFDGPGDYATPGGPTLTKTASSATTGTAASQLSRTRSTRRSSVSSTPSDADRPSPAASI